MVKKILSLLLSSFALFALVSCTNEEVPSSNNSSSENSVSSIPSSSIQETFHVVFKNYDESILQEIDVLKGQEAIYSGETPTKEEDDEFTYEFEGWDQDLTNIQTDVTTYAKYKATGKEGWGTIIWF